MKRPDTWIVTEDCEKPARRDGTCFWCGAPIGSRHKPECCVPKKSVIVDFTVRLPVFVPDSSEYGDFIEVYFDGDAFGYFELYEMLKNFYEKNEDRMYVYNEEDDEYDYKFNEISAKFVSDADEIQDEMAV